MTSQKTAAEETITVLDGLISGHARTVHVHIAYCPPNVSFFKQLKCSVILS